MSIFYNGNTYNFGATVAPVLGTGNGQYVFSGLSPDTSYGFLIWSYNAGGTSSIVGPLQILTASLPAESREIIGAFSWMWEQNSNYSSLQYYTGSDINLFKDSSYLGSDWWGMPGLIRTAYPELMPTGDTGWVIGTTSGYSFLMQYPTLDAGATYIVSWYQHTGSSSGLYFQLYGQAGGSDTVPMQQILPQVGTGYTASSGINPLLGPTGGQTGWIRYAVQFYTTGTRRIFYLPFRITNVTENRSFIIGGPQLEKQQ